MPRAPSSSPRELADCLADAANDPECECDLDVALERLFDGYRVRSQAPELDLAREALRDAATSPCRSSPAAAATSMRCAQRAAPC